MRVCATDPRTAAHAKEKSRSSAGRSRGSHSPVRRTANWPASAKRDVEAIAPGFVVLVWIEGNDHMCRASNDVPARHEPEVTRVGAVISVVSEHEVHALWHSPGAGETS